MNNQKQDTPDQLSALQTFENEESGKIQNTNGILNTSIIFKDKQCNAEPLKENDIAIKIDFNSESPTVSARDLHEGLKIKSNFTTWFNRMCEYGFNKNEYKKCFPNLESGCNGGQNMIDYQISIDMAKQICMIQRTELGKQYHLEECSHLITIRMEKTM